MLDACGGGDPRGYARWPFYEFLSERFGRGVIKEIFVRAGAGVPSLDTLDAVLATHGTTLSQVFADFTIANLTGDYTLGPHGGPRATARVSIDTGTAPSML